MILISDPHFGLSRRLGVTPESLAAYQKWQLDTFSYWLLSAEEPVLITGDLFDKGEVSFRVVLDIYRIIQACNQKVYILRGNHDILRDRSKLSSLMFLDCVTDVEVITEPRELGDYALIPHMANQRMFDEAVDWAEESGKKTLITHVNYDNHFALEQDHSLNLTPEQAAKFERVISGHEHQVREIGNVTMLGSMLPTQVMEAKGEHVVWRLGEDGQGLTRLLSAPSAPSYAEIDWHELDGASVDAKFVKVTGEATTEEGAEVIRSIYAFRGKAGAMMVQNAVTIDSLAMELSQEDSASLEQFDSIRALIGLLRPKTVKRLEELDLC